MVMEDAVTQSIRGKFLVLERVLDERAKRLWAAAEARSLGRGGVTWVAEATGMSRSRVHAGLREIGSAGPGGVSSSGRQRAPGGGRKRVEEKDAGLVEALRRLVDPATRGDPTGPLLWTTLSAARLSEALGREGHPASERTVNRLLHDLGYSLQSNRKTVEGRQHPDRDAQFRHVNRKAKTFQGRGEPVVSVDTKKKELVGNFRNGGREWHPKGEPEKVLVHDFKDKELGKAIPYGVYDLAANNGWVSVGVDHDTASFAAESVRRWWERMGRHAYPDAKRLLVTADAGGSNGPRNRLWKVELQRVADATGLEVSVCHFPPGTSKWNKIEHRMFCWITENWRGRPLVSREAVVELIANTTTRGGLSIRAELDENEYPTGVKVSDEELAGVRIRRSAFHGDWNYMVSPNKKTLN